MENNDVVLIQYKRGSRYSAISRDLVLSLSVFVPPYFDLVKRWSLTLVQKVRTMLEVVITFYKISI